LHDYDVESVEKMDAVPHPLPSPQPSARQAEDITAIDLELVSFCFSEDEEIIEWETLIDNGLHTDKNNFNDLCD